MRETTDGGDGLRLAVPDGPPPGPGAVGAQALAALLLALDPEAHRDDREAPVAPVIALRPRQPRTRHGHDDDRGTA